MSSLFSHFFKTQNPRHFRPESDGFAGLSGFSESRILSPTSSTKEAENVRHEAESSPTSSPKEVRTAKHKGESSQGSSSVTDSHLDEQESVQIKNADLIPNMVELTPQLDPVKFNSRIVRLEQEIADLRIRTDFKIHCLSAELEVERVINLSLNSEIINMKKEFTSLKRSVVRVVEDNDLIMRNNMLLKRKVDEYERNNACRRSYCLLGSLGLLIVGNLGLILCLKHKK